MYDYVIVGGGSSGCALACRLSEDADARVLLIEAGPTDTDPDIHMPVGFAKMTDGPFTWGYRTVPQKHANDRVITFPQGRVIGGGGSINAQVFTRGAPQDYDRWAHEEGCPGWSFADVRPYFVRSEHNERLVDGYHGAGGPLGVSDLVSPQPMSKVFVRACQEVGIPYTADFNGARQAGCALYQVTQRGGKRCSAAAGYLRRAQGRANLTVVTDAFVRSIEIERGRATGVDYYESGQPKFAAAAREVIVAAGAIGSPKLLMLSGIGPADDLRGLGIEVRCDLPGVGQNLQDHFDIDMVYELKGPHSLDKYRQPHWKLWAGIEYKLFGTGPVTSNIAEGGAFWFADTVGEIADTQFHFLPGAGVEAGVPPVPSGYGVTLNSYFTRPRSRGSVKLASADPTEAPRIDPNYVAEPDDLRITAAGLRIGREIMNAPAFRPYILKEHFPGPGVTSLAEFEDYARQYGRTSYHPVGTCKMGSDEMAVVDPALRVRGIDGLRVTDSSIMPSLIGSNTNAASMMIGEMAADLIRGNRP